MSGPQAQRQCSTSLSGEIDARTSGADQPQTSARKPSGGPGSSPGRSTLTARQREALIVAYLNGFSHADLASQTIRSLLRRGLIVHVFEATGWLYRTTEAGARLVKEMT